MLIFIAVIGAFSILGVVIANTQSRSYSFLGYLLGSFFGYWIADDLTMHICSIDPVTFNSRTYLRPVSESAGTVCSLASFQFFIHKNGPCIQRPFFVHYCISVTWSARPASSHHWQDRRKPASR